STSASSAPEKAADPEARVVVANFRAPVSNWALESDDAYVLSIAGCLETLAKYDQGTKTVEPMLATSWKQSSDTEWDFELRKNVEFQDGTIMDAKAVAASLNHVLKATAPARAVNPKT
ncbi:peptide ABC transporter, partial [Escherichia coli]|nr:peptide ABC transporter [Escherichia coli]